MGLCDWLRMPSSFVIATELLNHRAMGAQSGEGARALILRVDLAINVKNVFPGSSMDGARLNFGEIGSQGREIGERRNERAGLVFNRKCNADLVGAGSVTASRERRTRKKRVKFSGLSSMPA